MFQHFINVEMVHKLFLYNLHASFLCDFFLYDSLGFVDCAVFYVYCFTITITTYNYSFIVLLCHMLLSYYIQN